MSRPIVLPSGTDIFGLVMIEALACGTPGAAFPVASPRDILTDGVGAMSEDLAAAVSVALTRARSTARKFGAGFSWAAATRQFIAGLAALEPQAKAG